MIQDMEEDEMGAKYTESQKKATLNYLKEKQMLSITVSLQEAEIIREGAKEEGKSLKRYIVDCVRYRRQNMDAADNAL